MSYDFDDLPIDHVPSPNVVPAQPLRHDDLELIVLCLELGALMLTSKPGDVFDRAQLFRAAHEMGDAPGVVFDDADAEIVLANVKFLKKVPGGYILR